MRLSGCRFAAHEDAGFQRKFFVRISPPDLKPASDDHLLLLYVADLELEVDRLRKHGQFLRQAVREALASTRAVLEERTLPDEPSARILESVDEVAAVMRDLEDPPGYHPAHDQVIAIAVRPMVEQVFRWQQRLSGASRAILHLELGADTINWFPARFRHILDNLVSNALKYRDLAKGECRVTVSLSRWGDSIELSVSDNGLGMPSDMRPDVFELFYRSAPIRSSGPGVGLAVVKLLIEQSGGSLTVDSGEGKGSNFTARLPRYDVGDFLT
jgi:signal transduction histidine kinase